MPGVQIDLADVVFDQFDELVIIIILVLRHLLYYLFNVHLEFIKVIILIIYWIIWLGFLLDHVLFELYVIKVIKFGLAEASFLVWDHVVTFIFFLVLRICILRYFFQRLVLSGLALLLSLLLLNLLSRSSGRFGWARVNLDVFPRLWWSRTGFIGIDNIIRVVVVDQEIIWVVFVLLG